MLTYTVAEFTIMGRMGIQNDFAKATHSHKPEKKTKRKV